MPGFIKLINKKVPLLVMIVIFFVLGTTFGYSIGLGEDTERGVDTPVVSARSGRVQVLGVETIPHYVNPFKTIDVVKVNFPVAQLKGCRNFNECHTYCSQPENFEACVAWSKR